MQAEFEARDDPEISAPAANAPVEVGILVGGRVQQAAVGGDDIDRAQVVDREAEAPRQPAESAAERQASDTGMGDGPCRRHEAMRHRLVVDLAQQAAALDPGDARERIDANAAQAREVDLHASVARGLAAEAVAAAFHGDEQLALAREAHRVADVRDARRLHDERRTLVDRAVQHTPRFVVARVAGQQQRAAQARLELRDRRLLDDRRRAVELDRGEAARGLRSGLVERVEPGRRQRVCDRGGERGLEETAAVDHQALSGGHWLVPWMAERSSRNAA